MRGNIFLDSNVCLYSLSKDEPLKQQIARKLLSEKPFISVQVVFEFVNVSIKKFGYNRKEAIENTKLLVKNSELMSETKETIDLAFLILKKYKLQPFDSKIVASALLSDCKILYSEDLHHKQVFERKLKVINPFI